MLNTKIILVILVILFTASIAAYGAFYLLVPEVWWRTIKIQKTWECNDLNSEFKGFAYFPNHGPPQNFNENKFRSMCPEITFDMTKSTLLITRGLTLVKFRVKPLEQWRLSKSWNYGYPDFEKSTQPEKIFIYLIPITKLGEPL